MRSREARRLHSEGDAWNDPAGHAFAARVEHLLDGPEDSDDPTTWRTEVAIKVRDSRVTAAS